MYRMAFSLYKGMNSATKEHKPEEIPAIMNPGIRGLKIDDNDFKLDESYLLSEIKKEFKILN